MRHDATGNDHAAPASHRQHGIGNNTAKKPQHHIGRIAFRPGICHRGFANVGGAQHLAAGLQPVDGLQPAAADEMFSRYMRHFTAQGCKQFQLGITLR